MGIIITKKLEKKEFYEIEVKDTKSPPWSQTSDHVYLVVSHLVPALQHGNSIVHPFCLNACIVAY